MSLPKLQLLCAKAEFAQFAGNRVRGEFFVVFCDGLSLPRNRVAFITRPPDTSMRPIVPSSYFIGIAHSHSRDEIDFPRG
jgi:hypothetical protein